MIVALYHKVDFSFNADLFCIFLSTKD